MENLWNLDQAGIFLGLSRAQVYALTRQQSQIRRTVKLPVVHVGKFCRFRPEALRAWVLALEAGAK